MISAPKKIHDLNFWFCLNPEETSPTEWRGPLAAPWRYVSLVVGQGKTEPSISSWCHYKAWRALHEWVACINWSYVFRFFVVFDGGIYGWYQWVTTYLLEHPAITSDFAKIIWQKHPKGDWSPNRFGKWVDFIMGFPETPSQIEKYTSENPSKSIKVRVLATPMTTSRGF